MTSPDGLEETTTTFDARGNPVKQDAVFADPDNGDHHVTGWEYTPDDRDLITKRVDPNGNTWSATWDTDTGKQDLLSFTDAEGQPGAEHAGAKAVFAGYNEFGQPGSITDPTGLTTTYSWNPDSGVLDGLNAGGHTQRFSYDGRGQLTGSYDELERHTRLDCRAEGWVSSSTDPRGRCRQPDDLWL